jgi:hypothetical protein
MSKLARNRRSVIAGTSLFLVLLAAGGLLGYVYYRQDADATAVDPAPRVVTNVATVSFCSAGDEASVCNPSAGIYSGSATSNTVSIPVDGSVEAISLCFKVNLGNRTSTGRTHSKVSLQINESATNVQIFSSDAATLDAAGLLKVDLPIDVALVADRSYAIWIKPSGYLAQRKLFTNIGDQCNDFGEQSPFIGGDLNDSNRIELADLVTAIRALNGGGDALTQEVYRENADKRPLLRDLVDIIRSLNFGLKGDDRP